LSRHHKQQTKTYKKRIHKESERPILKRARLLYELRETYSEADRLRLNDHGYWPTPGFENMRITDDVLKQAAEAIDADPRIRSLDKDTTSDSVFNYGVANLAQQMGIPSNLHGGTKMARNEYLDPQTFPSDFPDMIPGTIHGKPDFDSLEALRHEAEKGYFRAPIKSEEINPDKLAKGGLVKPKFFANGGFVSKGTDTVPAMLSPGEYVVKSQRVKELGTSLFDNINSGSFSAGSFSGGPSVQSFSSPSFNTQVSPVSISQGSVTSSQVTPVSSSSVYNYNLSVNVASQSDPNAIAQTVMGQIRSIDSQRIRSNRF
jgi:hypothetical protein